MKTRLEDSRRRSVEEDTRYENVGIYDGFHFPERTSEITDFTSARFKPAFLACFLAFAIRVANSSIEGGEMAFMMTVSLLAITTI